MNNKFNRVINFLKNLPLEAYLWIAGLIYLMFINPYSFSHFTFCPFHNLGIEFCPGCGLGKSISFIYHVDFISSLKAHPLGLFALAVIIYRITKLILRSLNKNNLPEVYNG